jgi:hypothetical protein
MAAHAKRLTIMVKDLHLVRQMLLESQRMSVKYLTKGINGMFYIFFQLQK